MGKIAARAAHATLGLAIALQPLGAGAVSSTATTSTTDTSTMTSLSTATWSAPKTGEVNQQGLQQNAGNANNTGSTFSTIASVLSMAAGGVAIAMGAAELSCCSHGCMNGSGMKAVAENGAIMAGAAAAGAVVGVAAGTSGGGGSNNPPPPPPPPKPPLGPNGEDPARSPASGAKRQPVDFFRLRFPDQARFECPRLPSRSSFSLLELFRPAPAAANGCMDGLLALATGGLLLMNGMLGMQGAKKAAENGAASMSFSEGMGSFGGFGATAGTGSHANDSTGNTKSGIGTGKSSPSTVKLDPALLRSGTANDIMGQFENKFGIPRDEFANGVLAGKDPREILGAAPTNPISNADMNKAIEGAQNMTEDERKDALAKSPMGAVQAELLAKMNEGQGVDLAAGGKRAPAAKKSDEALMSLDGFGFGAVKPAGPEPLQDLSALSPEVRDALAAKHLENEVTLFARVHAKYLAKTKMILGFKPGELSHGAKEQEL